MQPVLEIKDFSGGYADQYGRGKAPLNTFVDSKNLVPTKIGSLETTHGYLVDDTWPTGFIVPDADSADTLNLTTAKASPFAYSAESPTSYDGKVHFIADTDGTNHVAFDYWFKGGTRETTYNDGWVVLDERKILDGNGADITLNATTVTVANAATHGLVTDDDYYNGWVLIYLDVTGPSYYSWVVTDYAVTAGTATITVLGKPNSLTKGAGDTITLQRWFHRARDMNPDFDTRPGNCFVANGVVRGSGGASSSQHKFPWRAEYINRTFWDGVTGAEFTYQGTYVDEMECSPWAMFLATLTNGDAVRFRDVVTTGGTAFSTAASFRLGWTLEYDGYQESQLVQESSSHAVNGSTELMRYYIYIHPGRMSKRVTAVNVYASQIISGVESQMYFIKRHDILSPAVPGQWKWQPDTGAGDLITDVHAVALGVTSSTSETIFDQVKWTAKGGTYRERTGRVQEASSTVRHIVSWKYAEVISGRAFFANFYDPNESQTFVDQVRFTSLGTSGASDYDSIIYDRFNYEFDVGTGTSEAINGLAQDSGWLIVFKDNSIHSKYISAYPETWTGSIISVNDGLYAEESLCRLPDGGIVFVDVNGVKLLRNQRILTLTANWEDTFFNLSGKSSIVIWYDKADKSINVTNGAYDGTHVFYRGYLDKASSRSDGTFAIPWYKIVPPDVCRFVCVSRDGTVYFTYAAADRNFAWGKSYKTYNSALIKPYLKTQVIVPDESAFVVLDKVDLVRTNGTGVAGTLQAKLYVDSTTVTTTITVSATDQAKTNIPLKTVATDKRMGRSLQIEYNTHASAEYNSTNGVTLHAFLVYGAIVPPANQAR